MHDKKEWTLYVKKFTNRYLINGLSGMALGLFSTLLIGLILKQIGSFMPNLWFGQFLMTLGQIAAVLTGVGIAVGVAHNLGASKLVLYSSVLNGLIGAYAVKLVNGQLITEGGILLSGAGDPLGAFLAAVIGVEIGRLVAGKTKLDILITPAVTIIAGSITGLIIGPPVSSFMNVLGDFIKVATELQPFFMGIVVSVSMGIFLTLPISSAAISMILGLSGIAAGASTAGCAAQMIGFAVMSYRENKINGLLAQGLGTSMLQMPNIIKNPKIWIPPILASAITGPLATMVFKMENVAAGAGMGTSGLVGPILTWQTMSQAETSQTVLLIKILAVYFIIPAILTLLFASFMRKKNWIKDGDLKLEV
ncbi:PTS transporter subunit IIC [Cellulosilyticum sp. I15G10I2]|uniref:PTS transporter subunit IIC n=1 Tax=Cellulosilyticum sp. I15G10I2 TaxID=1892843 RepID=UPI00085C025C|nr:PTS sugar transporter subunit IIC [Cellulosilyticum sp. I15G10I2]